MTTYVYDNSADARTFEQALDGPQKIIGKDGGYDPSDEHEQYSMKSGGGFKESVSGSKIYRMGRIMQRFLAIS